MRLNERNVIKILSEQRIFNCSEYAPEVGGGRMLLDFMKNFKKNILETTTKKSSAISSVMQVALKHSFIHLCNLLLI